MDRCISGNTGDRSWSIHGSGVKKTEKETNVRRSKQDGALRAAEWSGEGTNRETESDKRWEQKPMQTSWAAPWEWRLFHLLLLLLLRFNVAAAAAASERAESRRETARKPLRSFSRYTK